MSLPLKRLAGGLFPWASLPCQEALEFLGFGLINCLFFHLSCLLCLFCFAPCPTPGTTGITAIPTLCYCLAFQGWYPRGLACAPVLLSGGAALLLSPLGTNCTLTFYFQWSPCLEGRVSLGNGSIFLAPFQFLWFKWICMPLYLQAFLPNIYLSCLFFMSHAYPVQFGLNSSSFFPVLCFTSLILECVEYPARPPTISTLTRLLTGFCRAHLRFSHDFWIGPVSSEVRTLQCSHLQGVRLRLLSPTSSAHLFFHLYSWG